MRAQYLKKKNTVIKRNPRVWLVDFGFPSSLSFCHTYMEPCCSTHWSSDARWETWISLCSLTSLRIVVPGCLICRVSIPPAERERHAQTPNTHTVSPLRNITPLVSIEGKKIELIWLRLFTFCLREPNNLSSLCWDPCDVSGIKLNCVYTYGTLPV